MVSLIRGSEPFFLPAGAGGGQTPTWRSGCLLIHGFTGTPYEMRGLGKRLAAEGYAVYGPRLAHHGTLVNDMNRSRWWDWYASALDGLHLLQANCEQLFVIGLSMGGLTALMLAANNPVAGVITMSSPAVFRNYKWRFRMARFVWPFLPVIGKREQGNEEDGWPSYHAFPVRGAAELQKYSQQLDAALPSVTAPALLMHARQDAAVPPANLDYIYDKISSTHKKKVWIERGGHVMTEDVDKERVYQEVIDFLRETAA